MKDKHYEIDMEEFALAYKKQMKKHAVENSSEVTVKEYCVHQKKEITISTNPFKNECERCFEWYMQEINQRLT